MEAQLSEANFELTERKEVVGNTCRHTAIITQVGHPENSWEYTDVHDADEDCTDSRAHSYYHLGWLTARDERFQNLFAELRHGKDAKTVDTQTG